MTFEVRPLMPCRQDIPSFRRRRGGQVLVMALLAMTLLVGLIFYVYNTGDQVNRRLTLQNVADSCAVSGGAWMARSLNIAAMNNCAQSRMIALVPIFDAAPLATEMALGEVTEWERCLAAQLARELPSTPNDFLRSGLETLRQRMATQRDILLAFDAVVNKSGFEMALTTHWAVPGVGGSPPHGSMWRAAMALEDFSDVVLETAGPLAQAEAVRFGRTQGADAAFLLPVTPAVPTRVGKFTDFRPVLEGEVRVVEDQVSSRWTRRHGGGIPDFADPHRLGPWAKLFRWRYGIYSHAGGRWVPGPQTRGSRGAVRGGRRVGLSSRSSDRGYWTGGRATLIGYRTFGPFAWALRRINWYADDHYYYRQGVRGHRAGHVPDTYFYRYLRDLARTKFSYMFTPQPTRSYHYSRWVDVTDYPKAVRRAAQAADTPAGAPTERIYGTMFYMVDVASSIPPSSPNYMKKGTYRTNSAYPAAIWMRGWRDPAKWGIPQVKKYVWRGDWTYETIEDRAIGIFRRPVDPAEPEGEAEWQKVYMTGYYVWGGIDVGGEVEIVNPCNWDAYDRLPRPHLIDPGENGEYDYDPDVVDHDEGARREFFSYLAVARDDDGAKIWRRQFRSASPLNAAVTVAQAKVFNNLSWDLWTQDWQVQLAPVSKWDQWVERMEKDEFYLDEAAGLIDDEAYAELLEYFLGLDVGMVETYISH